MVEMVLIWYLNGTSTVLLHIDGIIHLYMKRALSQVSSVKEDPFLHTDAGRKSECLIVLLGLQLNSV